MTETFNKNNEIRAVYFDMDGTLADLEGVDNWIPKLRASDVSPYLDAKPIVDMEEFNRAIAYLNRNGIKVGIVSWGSMNATTEFDRAARRAKWNWCNRHFDTTLLQEFHVVPYGTDKHSVVYEKNSLLVDDNASVRSTWKGTGTLDAGLHVDMLGCLKEIVKE